MSQIVECLLHYVTEENIKQLMNDFKDDKNISPAEIGSKRTN